jgi:aminoglycoside phosphotransferase (APT) family kinase protein
MLCTVLIPELACTALRAVALDYHPAEVRVEPREACWLVRLPQDRLAWFAASACGLHRLRRERHVLRLLAARCTFAVPRLLCEAVDGSFDVRRQVVGDTDPRRVYAWVRHDPHLARDIGEAIGHILVEQHIRITAADVVGWLPERMAWPASSAWIQEHLPRVVHDAGLVAEIESRLQQYETLQIDAADRLLVHGDVGLHNLAMDPATCAVQGIFDYGEAAWADRHHDFRYLLFDVDCPAMLEGACAVYEPAVARTLSRWRIALYNAVCAGTYLAFRAGVRPEVHWCGRTLVEDLGWTRYALARLRGMEVEA